MAFLTNFALANTNLKGSGYVAGASIEMNLSIAANGAAVGEYHYLKTNIPIKLEGKLTNNKLELLTSPGQNIEEMFIGDAIVYQGDVIRLSGKWYGSHTGYGKNDKGYDFNVSSGTGPLDDKKVTCSEMAEIPSLAFRVDDLGSGYGSPIDVDYTCPKSIASLDFMQALITQANEIQGDRTSPRQCTGSIIHATWRFFNFDLAVLGYHPQGYRSRMDKQRITSYFEHWGNSSLYNQTMYRNFMAEYDKAHVALIKWYMQDQSIDRDLATQFADTAALRVMARAAGSAPMLNNRTFVKYTEDAIKGNITQFSTALALASKNQKLATLHRLLISGSDIKTLKLVVDNIAKKTLDPSLESPISNAVKNTDALTLLLESGFDPEHNNNFGKTPLYYAIQFNQPVAVKKLLEVGAQVNHAYHKGNLGRWDCINITQWGRTPLMHAAQHSNVNILKLLVEQGADVKITDENKKVALDYATLAGRQDNVEYLEKL